MPMSNGDLPDDQGAALGILRLEMAVYSGHNLYAYRRKTVGPNIDQQLMPLL